MHSQAMTRRLQTAVLVITIVLLPLDFQPLRFEPHEPHRAGLLLILVLVALPMLHSLRLTRSTLLLAVLFWCVALVLATFFALSPTRAFWGDLIRRMGLLTQLALVAAAMYGAVLKLSQVWRWFWLAGVIVAAYVCLQAAGLIPGLHVDNRPPGPFGVPTFTAGWLALAGLWSGIGLCYARLPQLWRNLVVASGLVLMLIALTLTESRGAALALTAGCATATLLWTAVHHARRLALAIAVLAVLIGGGVAAIPHLDWDNSLLPDLPLIGRFNPQVPDLPRASREEVWTHGFTLTREWPRLTDINGEEDQWHLLRPIVGYGHETFESLFRLSLSTERAIDRAHNDWLDTLLTTGWLGLLARLSLWLAAWWEGLKRLGLNHWGIWLTIALGLLITGLAFWNSPFFPIAMTVTAFAGCWLWLLWTSVNRAHSEKAFNIEALLALAILTAYIVDLQFSFVTVATSWPAWLAFGLLLKPAHNTPPTDDHQEATNPDWIWVGLAGALLLRGMFLLAASWIASASLLLLLAAVTWFIRPVPRAKWLWIAVLWGTGWLSCIAPTPEVAAFWDVAWLSFGIWVLAKGKLSKLRPVMFLWLVTIVFALGLWARDMAADIYLSRAMQLTDLQAASEIRPAISLRPWDDRLLAASGNLSLRVAVSTSDASVTEWLESARHNLLRAAALNGYDANYAYLLALTEEQFALISSNAGNHIDRADAYFAAATRLWPTQAYFWREWARFTWDLTGDGSLADERVRQALRLDPADESAQALLVEIGAASR